LSFDFGELAAWFRSINTGSAPGIVSLGRAQRVVVDGDFLYSKADYATPPDTVDLSEHDVVLVSNGASPLYVKTTGIVRWPLTLIATGSIYIAGDLEGSYVRDGGPLALVTMGDFVVAEPSWASGSWDWPRPWNIDTERSLLLRAVLVAPTGTIRAQDPSIPEGRERVSLTGSLVLYSMNGTMGYTDNGYELTVSWDAGLSVSHPPLFRSLDRWSVISWTLDPDYDGLEIDDDLF
jgi:hypothetical protein